MQSEIEGVLGRDGFAVIRGVAEGPTLAEMSAAFDRAFDGGRAGTRLGGEHNGLIQWVASLAKVRARVADMLGYDARPVRGLLFDKSANANWDVAWHRDTTIAVRERREVEGYGPWSVKRGVVHVRPPTRVLQGMVTVRLHLDDCPRERGALLLAPGSHHDADSFAEFHDPDSLNASCVAAEVTAGDTVLMRPLILHASRKNSLGGRRRVIHVEFAACDLDGGLEWAW